MKTLLFIAFLSLTSIGFSQKQKIISILNEQLKQEVKQQFSYPDFSGDTLIVAEPFKITGTILSVAVKRKNQQNGEYFTQKQSVDLAKITAIAKDINVFFETEKDAITVTSSDKNIGVQKGDLFLLHLQYEKANEYLGTNLINAFKEAGYSIKMGSWFD